MEKRLKIGGHRIVIEEEIRTFSKGAFTGCLAHELAHLVLDIRRSFLENIWKALVTLNYTTLDEREADRLVVERGLGKELLQFHKEFEKDYEPYDSSEGLTKREIKMFLKSKK